MLVDSARSCLLALPIELAALLVLGAAGYSAVGEAWPHVQHSDRHNAQYCVHAQQNARAQARCHQQAECLGAGVVVALDTVGYLECRH